jgi:gp45 sliding clamp, C terminal
MKISKQTIEILRNYASINQNILIKAGNVLTTRTVAKNLFASATVDTEFPQEFGIYNLSTFLGVLSLFSDPDIELSEKSMIISQGKNKVQYLFASPEVLDYPDKAINMPAGDASFELSEENLKSLLKAGAVLSSTDLKISGNGSVITCTVLDPKNVSANTFSVEVGESDREFDVFIKLENLKLLTGKYNVALSEKKIAHFSNAAIEYSLYIANERNSTWVVKE